MIIDTKGGNNIKLCGREFGESMSGVKRWRTRNLPLSTILRMRDQENFWI